MDEADDGHVAPVEDTASEELIAPFSSIFAESYIQKVVLFAIILAVVAWFLRRRRSNSDRLDEKVLAQA